MFIFFFIPHLSFIPPSLHLLSRVNLENSLPPYKKRVAKREQERLLRDPSQVAVDARTASDARIPDEANTEFDRPAGDKKSDVKEDDKVPS
ncbi:hypothetical protein ACLB2K_046831 [Fragaria x ananassa]